MWAVFRNNYIDQDCEKITKTPRISQKRIGQAIQIYSNDENKPTVESIVQPRRPKASKVFTQELEQEQALITPSFELNISRRPKLGKVISTHQEQTQPVEQNIKRRRPRMFRITPSQSENLPISVVMGIIKRPSKLVQKTMKINQEIMSLNEFLFTDYSNPNLHPNLDRKIPKNIFRTFKHDFNESVRKSWTEKHPDYNYYFFNDTQCMNFIKNNFSPEIFKTYMSLNIGAPRADLFRCCILFLYGGVYIDIDCECVERIDDYIKDYTFVCPIDTERARFALFNAFMASSPRNNILYHMIQKIVHHTRNKLYAEKHSGKGDAFSATGPGALGSCFNDLLGNPYKTEYHERVYHHQIPYLTRIDINTHHENEFELKVADNCKNALFYYPFSDLNDCNIPYNFSIEKFKGQYKIEKTSPQSEKGWNYKLSVAVEQKSSKTWTRSFYFGKYNYSIGDSKVCKKTVTLSHQEYSKLQENIAFLKVDFLLDIISAEKVHPKFSNLYSWEIVNFTKDTITLEISRIDKNEGWDYDLCFGIYYQSLLLDTECTNLDNIEFKVYDFIDHVKSCSRRINRISSNLNYKIKKLKHGKILISLQDYENFLPLYTIINAIIDCPDYPEKQDIFLPWHREYPDSILVSGKVIINSQILQTEKNLIIDSYTHRPIYCNYEKQTKNKIAVVCSYPYHYELFGFLISMNKDWDFYAQKNGDTYSHISFYEKTLHMKFLSIENFNPNHYDFIINHTDDNVKILNPDNENLEKYIVIEHECYHRCLFNNSFRFLSVNKFSFEKRPIVVPVFSFISKQDKQEILKSQEKMTIIYFNNAVDCFHIDGYTDKLYNLIKNTNVKHFIRFFYRLSECNKDLISKLSTEQKVELIELKDPSMEYLMDCYKVSHYSIVGNEYLKHSGNIGLSLSAGCQILASRHRIMSLNTLSALCFDDLDVLTIKVNLNSIYKDIKAHEKKNHSTIHRMMNGFDLL